MIKDSLSKFHLLGCHCPGFEIILVRLDNLEEKYPNNPPIYFNEIEYFYEYCNDHLKLGRSYEIVIRDLNKGRIYNSVIIHIHEKAAEYYLKEAIEYYLR